MSGKCRRLSEVRRADRLNEYQRTLRDKNIMAPNRYLTNITEQNPEETEYKKELSNRQSHLKRERTPCHWRLIGRIPMFDEQEVR